MLVPRNLAKVNAYQRAAQVTYDAAREAPSMAESEAMYHVSSRLRKQATRLFWKGQGKPRRLPYKGGYTKW